MTAVKMRNAFKNENEQDWDSFMLQLFAVALEISLRGGFVPGDWEYRRGYQQQHERDCSYAALAMSAASVDDLVKFGNWLNKQIAAAEE